MKKSQEELKVLNFRKTKIREKIDELEGLLTGRQCSILPYITDESGEYSEEKIENFIKELLDCLTLGVDYHQEDPKELYTSFLHCAIRGATAEVWNDLTGKPYGIHPCETFEDVITVAEDFEADKNFFASDIEDMADAFLMRQELSCFCDEEKFVKAYTLTEQSCAYLKANLRKRNGSL